MNTKLISWPEIRPSNLGEVAVWAAIYVAYVAPVALGENNGMGYFQQPKGISLWAPLLLGGAVNGLVIYLHAYKAMPFLLQRGQRIRYAPVALAVVAFYLVAHILYQSILARTLEPSLRDISLSAWTIENLIALPGVIVISVIYRFGRDWVLHMSEHQRLAQRTSALEAELHLVKQEFDELKNGYENSYLKFESSRQKIQLPVRAILYVKSASNYIEVVTRNKSHLVYGSLSALIERLPPAEFARIHRSHVVNLNCVTALNSQQVEIDDTTLPVSASYRSDLMQRWDRRN